MALTSYSINIKRSASYVDLLGIIWKDKEIWSTNQWLRMTISINIWHLQIVKMTRDTNDLWSFTYSLLYHHSQQVFTFNLFGLFYLLVENLHQDDKNHVLVFLFCCIECVRFFSKGVYSCLFLRFKYCWSRKSSILPLTLENPSWDNYRLGL